MVEYKSFLDMPAPAGYVPGLGRGATGFTTRSDIGPARAGIAGDALKAAAASKKSEGENGNEEEEEDEDRFKDPENDTGLFSVPGIFDPEDEEADAIYNEIDKRMEERRKTQREAREHEMEEEYKKKNPKISDQFSDLKRDLGTVSAEQWANLPEVGDLTRKNKRQRKNVEQRFYAVPDSVLVSSANQNTVDPSIEVEGGGVTDGTMTDFRSISMARDKMLGLKLDQANKADGTASVIKGSDSAGGFTNVDPKGYLTSLSGSFIPSTTEVGDIRRVRPLLESLVKTDPKEPRGWIGLARLEELAKRTVKSRKVIQQGCDNCPRNEDVWLENMRLNEKNNAKIIAAKAVQFIPKSINLWIAACKLEDDINSQKRVLQKALEVNPHSDTLWRAAVNLEADSEDAKLMLTQAVELVPMSEDLWLALAHLETPANSRKVLNKARKALKTSRAVWIAAARLEEQDGGSQDKVYKRMERGVKELEAEGGLPDRAQWIAEAEKCEAEGAPLTCHAIIKATLGQGIEEEDRKSIWMEDGKDCIRRGSYETARAIYAYALQVFPESKSLWLATCQLEKLHGKKEALWEILEKAVKTSPHTEAFWLMYAKEKSIAGDILGAQEVLSRAFELNPNSEDIWLSAVSMEAESKNYDRARKLLERARQEADTERVWIKSVSLERQLANYDVALSLATEGLERYPQNPKLWMQKGQIYESLKEFHKAGQTYFAGTKACPFSVPLWLLLARFEQSQGVVIRARSTLDKASIVNPKNELIWLERIRLELREGNTSQTSTLISRALQECPNSGLIWSERILLEPRLQRKNKILEGVKACENDAFILITVGRDFWQNGKFGKAKTWFERAIKRDPDNGDGWIWFYKFLSEKGRPEDVQTLVDGFKAADPHHGLVWPEYLKDPSNFGKDLSEILKLAAASVQL